MTKNPKWDIRQLKALQSHLPWATRHITQERSLLAPPPCYHTHTYCLSLFSVLFAIIPFLGLSPETQHLSLFFDSKFDLSPVRATCTYLKNQAL